MSDPEWERILSRIADRAKPRCPAPALKPEKPPKVPKVRKLTLCKHGMRQWPTAGKKHCGPCWRDYCRIKQREHAQRFRTFKVLNRPTPES